MKNIFKGTLKGFICEECSESLSNIDVLIYLPYRENIVSSAVANPKETFHYVSKEEAKARENLFVAKTTTDELGNFQFEIDEKYANNSAFDVDFVCGTVPPKFPRPRGGEPVQFHITTLVMEWSSSDIADFNIFDWKYTISSQWWCYIKGKLFDVWTICGQLLNCETNTPLPKVTITAWDADLITDDNLGSAITDSNGKFIIHYTSVKFKQTFLSPWINIETDPNALTFQSGPDVYFKAIGDDGNIYINEKKDEARKNVPYCLCVKLCSKVFVGDPNSNFPSAWTGIGEAFSASFGSNSYDFDVDGFAGTGKYALSGVIRLTGQAALKSASGRNLEYRFLISDTTTPNGGSNPADSSFTKIIGVTPNLFYPSIIAKLTKIISGPSNNEIFVYSDQSDFNSDGWFDANKSINRALINAGLTPADLTLYNFTDTDTLISLNTAALTTAPNVPENIVNAGISIPAGNKIPIEKVGIRFEIRESITNLPITGNGKTLNSVVINNNPVFIKLSIAELETNGQCTPISGDIHAKYTAYHPYLTSSSLHLNNNSYTVNRDISDGILPLTGNTNIAVNEKFNNNCKLNNPPNDMTRCTYSLKLYARARLHNGDSAWSDSGPVEQIFFYEV